MSMPAKMILPSVSMEEAGKIMIRYNLDGLLVVEDEKVLGVVSKRDVDQAHHHKLSHARVSGFMSRPVITVEPGTTFSEIQSIMVRNNIGRLPIMSKDGQLLGVVSRSDVLRILFDKSSDDESLDKKPGPIKLSKTQVSSSTLSLSGEYRQTYNMSEQLSTLAPDTLWLYHQMGELAAGLNMVAYAVGGSVRDMILGQRQFDLDFVIEVTKSQDGAQDRSAISLAEKLVQTYPDKFKLANKHERFQTATIAFLPQEDRLIDLSTARQEFYEYPAALPSVEPSILKEDIFRRDFTINTLALSLNPDNFGTLIDYFNGLQDLQSGMIKVLHQFSFVEDPTRILRAARFAGRFGFRLDDNTAQLARQAIEMGIFDNLAGVRMKEELRLILELPSRLQALEILSKLGAKLRYLDQELEYGATERKLLRRAEQLLERQRVEIKEPWLVYLALLLSQLQPDRLTNVLGRMHLANDAKEIILRGLTINKEIEQSGKETTRSQIYKIFHNAADASLAVAASLSSPGSICRRAARLYLDELKGVHTELHARDLLQMGFIEGPELGAALEALLNAKLDQKVRHRQDEEEFIRLYRINSLQPETKFTHFL